MSSAAHPKPVTSLAAAAALMAACSSAGTTPSTTQLVNPGRWEPPQAVSGFGPRERITCASEAFCEAITFPSPQQFGEAVTYNGSAWSIPRKLEMGLEADPSCAQPGHCFVVDGEGDVVMLANGSWSSPIPVDVGGHLEALSCPALTFCMAIDNGGNALRFNGTAWSARVHVAPPDSYVVSCTSSAFCMVVNDDGDAFTVIDGRWSQASDVDHNAYPTGVSCATPQFCVLVDGGGDAAVYTGSWAEPNSVDPGQVLTTVSCSSTTFCMAADSGGRALAYLRGGWSSPQRLVSAGGGISSVACVQDLCVAVDSSGAVVYHRSG